MSASTSPIDRSLVRTNSGTVINPLAGFSQDDIIKIHNLRTNSTSVFLNGKLMTKDLNGRFLTEDWNAFGKGLNDNSTETKGKSASQIAREELLINLGIFLKNVNFDVWDKYYNRLEWDIISQMFDAVEKMHKVNVVNGDLKFEDIRVHINSDWSVKVIVLCPKKQEYKTDEEINSKKNKDVYRLGLIIHSMLCKKMNYFFGDMLGAELDKNGMAKKGYEITDINNADLLDKFIANSELFRFSPSDPSKDNSAKIVRAMLDKSAPSIEKIKERFKSKDTDWFRYDRDAAYDKMMSQMQMQRQNIRDNRQIFG